MNRKSTRISIILIIAFCVLSIFLCSCVSPKMAKYYSNKENYISVTGTISGIKYNSDFTVLYIYFSELNPTLDDTNFKIVGDNLKIVRNNGIDYNLKIGEQVEIVTAPKYFGDGYVMPIVAISKGNDIWLEFEDGYKNLQKWLS